MTYLLRSWNRRRNGKYLAAIAAAAATSAAATSAEATAAAATSAAAIAAAAANAVATAANIRHHVTGVGSATWRRVAEILWRWRQLHS